MSYQRLLWHSGLTYRAVCPACRQYVVYNDYNLGFRAWFPDGFVYCPNCRKPIRHNENNAIKPDGTPYFPFPIRTPPPPGYSAYPLEYLALNPQYVPPQNPPQPNMQQPGVQQPNMQQPQNMQQPYVQQPYVQQPNMQPQNLQQQNVQPPVPQTNTQTNVHPDPQPAAEFRKCPQCGETVENSDAMFCMVCGAKLDS